MVSFQKALKHVLKHEGGYVNHPADPGGRTYRGVTARTLGEWRGLGRPATKGELLGLSEAEVAEIYYQNYWRAAGCDHLPHGLAFVQFDAAVNHGPTGAVRMLQAIIRTGSDGIWGPQTWAALQHALAVAPVERLVGEYMAHRLRWYAALGHFSTFGKGWVRRAADTLIEALSV